MIFHQWSKFSLTSKPSFNKVIYLEILLNSFETFGESSEKFPSRLRQVSNIKGTIRPQRTKYFLHMFHCSFFCDRFAQKTRSKYQSTILSIIIFGFCFFLQKRLDSALHKVHIFWEGHNFLRNLHRRFDLCCK